MSYGLDTWCDSSLQPGRLVTGIQLVGQALFRRLITPRGTLQGGDAESAYGLEVASYVGEVGVATAVNALPGLVRAELMKDDRVSDVVVEAIAVTDESGLARITLEIEAVLEDSDEAFELTVAIGDLTAELVGLESSQ